MLNPVWLVICAMAFGSAMEKAGILDAVLKSLLKLTQSVGGLIATTIGTCFGVNALVADQYMAIVVPGRMFKNTYVQRGLHEKRVRTPNRLTRRSKS